MEKALLATCPSQSWDGGSLLVMRLALAHAFDSVYNCFAALDAEKIYWRVIDPGQQGHGVRDLAAGFIYGLYLDMSTDHRAKFINEVQKQNVGWNAITAKGVSAARRITLSTTLAQLSPGTLRAVGKRLVRAGCKSKRMLAQLAVLAQAEKEVAALKAPRVEAGRASAKAAFSFFYG